MFSYSLHFPYRDTTKDVKKKKIIDLNRLKKYHEKIKELLKTFTTKEELNGKVPDNPIEELNEEVQ